MLSNNYVLIAISSFHHQPSYQLVSFVMFIGFYNKFRSLFLVIINLKYSLKRNGRFKRIHLIFETENLKKI